MTKILNRELKLLLSTLKVSIKRDIRGSNTGKLLISKGFISKNTGKITEKGKKAIRLLSN